VSLDKEIPEEAMVHSAPERPGDLLRKAREAKGMTIEAVAEQTRVASRQLRAIEQNEFSALPGTPYAVGFARAFARAVGADEVEVARGVRQELGTGGTADRYEMFEPIDPARVPPRVLAWTAAIVAAVLAVAYGVWRSEYFAAPTDAELSSEAENPPAVVAKTPGSAPAAQPTGPVVLTAISSVWLRIYDQAGQRLLEKELAQGESYTVPANANNPMILTGRPDALAVTVGGRAVAPLGPPQKTIADVPISAAALLARPATTEPTPANGNSGQLVPTQPSAPVTVRRQSAPSSAQPPASTIINAAAAPNP
jgi:cytoskeleton protein RodZ